ncbi:MAG: hypothetical protein PUK70_09090 [Bacteroidales bacterium]|nr:hypothetical protein [Bacteroidales bacterium]MDY6001067.1 hypothetical protein [Candidatus Cryptobacteroides sp.]
MNRLLYIHPYVFITCGYSNILFYDTLRKKLFLYKFSGVMDLDGLNRLEHEHKVILQESDKIWADLTSFITTNILGGVTNPDSSPFISKEKYIIKHQKDNDNTSYYNILLYISQIYIDCRGSLAESVFSGIYFRDNIMESTRRWLKDMDLFKRLNSIHLICDSQTSIEFLELINNSISNNIKLDIIFHGDTIDNIFLKSIHHRKKTLSIAIDCNSYYPKCLEDNNFKYITYVDNENSYTRACKINEKLANKLEIIPDANADIYIRDKCKYSIADLEQRTHRLKDFYLREKINVFYWGKIFINHKGEYLSSKNNTTRTAFNTSLVDYSKLEMEKKGLWFFTRDMVVPCKGCAFRYLCPSISTIERNFNTFNLCTFGPC